MAASSDYDYANILNLDQAKIRRRKRLNSLGSRELIIEYSGIAPTQKEESIEWLVDNRLTLTDPHISFKDLTGTYKCVDIEYNDNANILTQRFKTDSQLGAYDPDTKTGTGDIVLRSVRETAERTFFWRIVDPDAIDIPASTTAGIVWSKSAVDNGDGTYDVTISKNASINTSLSNNVVAKDAISTTNADFEWDNTDPDALEITTVSAGTTQRKSLSKNSDGTYNIALEETVSSELSGDSVRATPLYTEYKTTTLNDEEIDFETYLTAWMGTISEYDLSEISPDAGFDNSGSWTTLTNATVSGSVLTLSPTVGAAALASAGNILVQGNNYHIVYTITSNPSALTLEFSGIEIPSTVGTHNLVINTDQTFSLGIAAGVDDDMVLSSFSCLNYYGVASSDYSAVDPTEAYELFDTSTPLGVEAIVENAPAPNGKFRTDGIIRRYKKNNYFSVPGPGSYTLIATKNYTRADFNDVITDITGSFSVSRFQYSVNALGLIDATFRIS